MHKPIDLTGHKYGKLTVISYHGRNKHNHKQWLCKCECGNKTIKLGYYLRNGQTKSCGCYHKKQSVENLQKATKHIKHKMCETRFYKIWENMKMRCYNPKSTGYKNYGGRGIKVSERWQLFENFKADMFESYEVHCLLHSEETTTLERMNVNSDYSVENCTWATKSIQNYNKRTNSKYEYKNNLYTLGELSMISNIHPNTIHFRIKTLHWPVEKAVEKPVNKKRKNKHNA